ncbi:MAG: 3-deoxy-7-phosphoheptulonate synthase [Cytophagales bacterium]|nr:3-deoxy-7-phosphoheptulonate synthase [Cytophagales bacterium]
MIIHLKSSVSPQEAARLAADHQAIHFNDGSQEVLVLSAKIKEVPGTLQSLTEADFPTDTDIQLASKSYQSKLREITIGEVTIGGDTKNTMMIAGPCSVESQEQVDEVAQVLKKLNVKTLRAGCFKPRTSPYTFQGLGEEGLKILADMHDKYGFNIITEVKDSSHVDMVIEYADIVQIGAKAMYDHSIGKRCGQTKKPILLKRGFGTTLQEFVQAAEFILSGGNPNVILCERGIRTFETGTRFTLDLCGVAFMKEKTNLPIVVDPSHAMGYRYGVADLTRAAIAMGVDGLLIETHPNPAVAKSDAAQQLDLDEFQKMHSTLQPIAQAIGHTLI